MKVLNLYSGIGGNRKLWENVNVVAVELNPVIAKVYQSFFPDDKVIIGNAHEYLLKHYKEFDFIWSSPPCTTHSAIRKCGVHKGQNEALYADMTLYEEIILLQHFAPKNTKWVVENVKPYYNLLIPGIEIEKHIFWSNFFITSKHGTNNRQHDKISENSIIYDFNIKHTNIKNKKQALRNLFNPYLGLHIINESKNDNSLLGKLKQ